MKKIAGIEGGGTKFICGIGDEQGNILASTRIETSTPEKTMQEVIRYLKNYSFDAIGMGVFGPVDLNIDSPSYGQILNTPKEQWKFYDILDTLKKEFDIPIKIEHDVGVALLAEMQWGAGRGLKHAVYYTVGTGIGAGLYLDGHLYHGELHSESGHMQIPLHSNDTGKGGVCPFHGSCLEGLVSGPAIEKRYGKKAETIPEDDKVWDFVAFYLATMCVNTMFCFSPSRIILGGGVMNQKFLFPKIRMKYLEILSGYDQKEIFVHSESYIVPPELENNAGLQGAFLLNLDRV